MILTKEQMIKMKSAKSVEELSILAKEAGMNATDKEIKAKFDAMHSEGILADDELDNVLGGDDCNSNESILGKRVRIKATGETGTVERYSGSEYGVQGYVIRFDDGHTEAYTVNDFEII